MITIFPKIWLNSKTLSFLYKVIKHNGAPYKKCKQYFQNIYPNRVYIAAVVINYHVYNTQSDFSICGS